MNITTIHSLDTEYSADTIEWCPHENYRAHFALGTYQLEGDNSESTSPPCRRKGRIYLYRFDTKTKDLIELYRQETAAILDMKWLPYLDVHDQQQKPLLATANALGQIEVFVLEADILKLQCCLDLNSIEHNLLALSLDVSNNSSSNNGKRSKGQQILASDSKGDITLIDYTAEGKLEKLHSWQAHNFEAWICAFDKWNTNVVYTGGDDTFLHAFDLRTYERTFTNRTHIAGVTCLLSHPQRENLLITGSYDERVRVFDTRSMKQAIGEINLGGGIWRLKADPLKKNLLLVACMYHNFSVVRLAGDEQLTPLLAGEYNEHKSICYGADWCMDATLDNELFMATCSFYDHKLCLSTVTEH